MPCEMYIPHPELLSKYFAREIEEPEEESQWEGGGQSCTFRRSL